MRFAIPALLKIIKRNPYTALATAGIAGIGLATQLLPKNEEATVESDDTKFNQGGIVNDQTPKYNRGGIVNNQISKYNQGGTVNNQTLKYNQGGIINNQILKYCLLYTSPSPRDATLSRMPSSA